MDRNGAKGCHEPIEVVTTSTCKVEYNSWALWMKTPTKGVTTNSSSSPAGFPKGVQLELPFGSYLSDEQQSKTDHVPPTNLSKYDPQILIVGAMNAGPRNRVRCC